MKNKILLSFSLISFFITFSSLIQADEAHDISNPENVEETLLGPSLNPSLMMLNSGSRIKGGSLAPIGEEIKDGEEWIEENIFQEENEATVTTVNSSSSQIARISSQIRPQSSSFQLTNVTAELSEQNEDKNEIIQSVKTEIQNNILLTETVNVAISVLQRKSEIQNALRIKRPDIDWDCTDMGSYILEQLREKLHEQYELEAAASLLHDKPTSVFLKNLNQDKSVAEKFEITAKEADIKARGIRTNALKYNLDQEFEAYQIAQDGWINVVSAYQCLLARAKIAQASGNIQESFNSEFFITSLKQAEAKESLWRAHAFWITVQQTETTITSSKGSLNADDASNLEIAWDKLVEAYEIAIKYDCATQDDNELIELLRQARTKKIYWSDQLSTFKFTSPTAIQNRKRSLASLLKSLQNRKTLLDRSARNTIWSKINQPSYQNWSLPEELLEVTTFGKETKEEKVGEVKKIMPPEVLDEECEVIGRQSLRQLNKIHLREKNISTEMPLDSFQQETKVSTILSRKDTYDPEEVIAAILEESFNPTERNKIRWDARAKADQWIDIAAEAGRRYQEAQEKKSGKVGIKGDNITDDGKSEFSEQQSFLDRRSKAVFWKPKLSMKGSKAGSSEGSRAGDTLKKTSKNLLIGTDLPNLSIPEKPTYEDLRTVDEAADQAKETWRALVLQAEQKRLSQPSTVKFLSKEIEEAWFKSDQKALKRQLEKIEQEKTELLAIELRESWERNSLRWKARSEADSLTKKSEELENKAQELDKEAINLLAQKMALKKEFGNQEKEESLQRKIKSTENEAKKTHNEAAEVQADATAAENTWINLAFTSNFFIESYKKGEDNGKKGFQQLRKSDQAVNKLWDEVKRLYNNNKLTNCPDLVLEEDDETNGTKEEYKTLLEAHQQDLQKLFEGDLDVKIAKANDLFRQGTVDSKDKADQLYQKIEQDEKKTLENYKATLKQEALRAAQKRITGAQEVLAERSIISKEQQEATKAFSKSTSNNSWEENKAQRNLKRATAVAEADETALQHFQEEEERLANIETLWMAIIEAKNKEILSERAKTARMYYEGNKKAWESLSSEAREEYNTEIIKINDEYKDAIKKNLDLATERAERARRYYNNTYFVLAFKAKAQALKAAEKAEADLEVLKTKAKERTEAIELAKLPSEQRDVKMKEKKYTENETKIKEKANAFIAQANTVADSAEATKAKAINASNEQIVNSWNEAIQSSKAAVTTWEEIISVLKQCRKEVPPLHQDLAWWNTQIEKAQTQQSDWEKKTVQYEDEKNETLKTKVSILSSKVIKAVKAAETAYTTAKTTNTASIKQKADCWNTTIQSSNSGVTAYTTAITALIQGSNEVSQSRQNLKVWWTTEIQKAQEQKSVWEENIVKYEKEKNDVLKNMAVTFLSQADRTTTSAHTAYNTANTVITISDQKVSLWNTAIRSSNNAVTNWIEAISTLQEGLKEVSQSCQDLKVWWTTELENAKNKKNEWSAVILRCKAKKEEC
ncbi:MAG TPA: hypothetical protein VJK54_02550, partial [Chthoniobacterales bacterium]|nr:hypothetical protein [Chthoniobacterales bacterium]